jgi:excisionase family DNA binding protein
MSSTDEPLAYSPTHAADVLGLSRATIYRLMNEGRIRARKLGDHRTLIDREELVRFVQGLPTCAPTPSGRPMTRLPIAPDSTHSAAGTEREERGPAAGARGRTLVSYRHHDPPRFRV